MKIVFTIKCINLIGGSEHSTIDVANGLVARGHNISIVSFIGKGDKPHFEVDDRICIHYLSPRKDKYPAIVRDIRRIVKLRKLYATIKPDIIVVVGTTRSLVNMPAARGYKVIGWEYFSVDHMAQVTSKISRWFTAKTADGIVTLSQYDANIYLKRWNAKKAVVIPNPLTLKNPQMSSLQNKVVLALGRMTRVKGYDMLLDAWKNIQHTDWVLYMVGDGGQRGFLEKKVNDEHIARVKFFPATSNVAPYYKEASIFALSSRSEAFGNVLTEAMSVGIPSVAFDCGAGPREIIQHNKTGILVKPNDVQAFSKALDELMDDPERLCRMGKNAKERVKIYDLETIMVQWENLFAQIKY